LIELQKAGKVRMVAVMGTTRQNVIPDTPTFAELGIKGFEDLPYYGIFAPKGTPTVTLERLGNAVAKVLDMPDVKQRLVAMGLTVEYMSSQALAQRESAYSKNWARIIEASGFQAQ
jgi:tripartite-type tricarboxylate transporter receptor subunit TctC